MDLSVVHRSSSDDQLTDTRPKFSFSVASLLASRGIQLQPSSLITSLKDEQEEQDEQDEQYEDSDISVDDDQEECDEQDEQDALERRLEESNSPRGHSPGGASPPRLAMPTPLLGGRLPIPLPPHLQGLGLPPGWPGFLPTSLSSLNPGLFKTGKGSLV